jgi:chemotaxis receptor (MCP) glutamine deamidase CheD/DNA-binding NarL/FixJ family response regulator
MKKIKVFLVDDQALVLDILAKGLVRDPRIEVVGTATDGQLALNQIPKLQPDVILLDMEMPRMNGIQLLKKLMPVNPIPTIVLSALTDKDAKVTQEAFEAGAIDFQSKPGGGAKDLPKLFVHLWTKIKMAYTKDVSYMKKSSATKDLDLGKTALDRKARTKNIILGMGAFDATKDENRTMKIYALGSCVGVALYSVEKPIVALAHIVLPSSATDEEKSKKMPGYFADTGIPAMIEKLRSLGADGRIVAKIAGGAKTRADVGDYFSVGQRNAVAVKATLLKHKVKVISEELGGAISRTVSVRPGMKMLEIAYPEKGTWQI